MARARNIKPGFFRNADLVDLPMEARLLFIGLWTLADREGRMEDRPKQIKIEIFPADNVDCDALLNEIASTGMVERYEVDGKRYLQVVNFTKHQNPHRDEKASTVPDRSGNYAEADCKTKKHGANTVQARCKDELSTVAIGLNPESGFLIPDSLIPDSVPIGTGGKPPMLPDEIIFGYGLPMLTNAGTPEKNARSFLGSLRKAHGDAKVVDALRDCIKAKPLQPLEWLAKTLPPNASAPPQKKPSAHSGLTEKNYSAGVNVDGTFT
jgi:hypothetical protein